MQGELRRGNPAPGDRPPVRRRRHVEPVAFEEVLDLAKRSETAIYAIGLRPSGSYRTEFKEAEFVLKQLAQETGGRAYFVLTAAELPKIYEQISEELANHTPSPTRRRIRCATARGAGWSCA